MTEPMPEAVVMHRSDTCGTGWTVERLWILLEWTRTAFNHSSDSIGDPSVAKASPESRLHCRGDQFFRILCESGLQTTDANWLKKTWFCQRIPKFSENLFLDEYGFSVLGLLFTICLLVSISLEVHFWGQCLRIRIIWRFAAKRTGISKSNFCPKHMERKSHFNRSEQRIVF